VHACNPPALLADLDLGQRLYERVCAGRCGPRRVRPHSRLLESEALVLRADHDHGAAGCGARAAPARPRGAPRSLTRTPDLSLYDAAPLLVARAAALGVGHAYGAHPGAGGRQRHGRRRRPLQEVRATVGAVHEHRRGKAAQYHRPPAGAPRQGSDGIQDVPESVICLHDPRGRPPVHHHGAAARSRLVHQVLWQGTRRACHAPVAQRATPHWL